MVPLEEEISSIMAAKGEDLRTGEEDCRVARFTWAGSTGGYRKGFCCRPPARPGREGTFNKIVGEKAFFSIEKKEREKGWKDFLRGTYDQWRPGALYSSCKKKKKKLSFSSGGRGEYSDVSERKPW